MMMVVTMKIGQEVFIARKLVMTAGVVRNSSSATQPIPLKHSSVVRTLTTARDIPFKTVIGISSVLKTSK